MIVPSEGVKKVRSHMKKIWIGLALGLFLSTPALADDGIGGKLPWTRDYEAGRSEARMTGQPIALYFGAKW